MKSSNAKFTKIVTIITIITTVITILITLSRYIFPMKAASIGIIGGADGPTTIFVSGNHFIIGTTIIFLVISIIGISYLLFTKKMMK